jgi:hypothetical protein
MQRYRSRRWRDNLKASGPGENSSFAFSRPAGLEQTDAPGRAPGHRQKNMRDEQRQFLMLLAHPPARLNVEQAAWVLNCQAHDIPTLIAARLLKPLGNPPRNGTKYFSTAQMLELAKDPAWLAKATNAIHQFWQRKNDNKRRPGDDEGCEPLAV